jgi:dTDP-4-amino-4,6-dideoxygalactose transaminase
VERSSRSCPNQGQTLALLGQPVCFADERFAPVTLLSMHEVSERRATMLGFQPPAIGDEEIAAVAETLRSGWLTTGPRAAELERRMAEYLEAEHVLALASGTAALHLSLVALGVGPGDEVITTPITWPATANVIVHSGATPVFVDVREDDLNIDPARAAEAVTGRTKAILPVDLAGQPAELDPIVELGVPVIEDAAHAAESRYRGRKIGSIADATCFSLYATKNIAAGEGGLISTNRTDVAEAVRDLRLMRRGDGSRYDIPVPGYKANLSDVLAAIALCQLDKVDRHAEIRAGQFAAYDEAVAELDGITPLARDDRDVHALHLYVIRIDAQAAGASRDEYQHALAEENIATSIHFLPVHKLTWYRERFPDQPPLPVAERAGDEVLSLPLSPAHSDDDIADVIAALRSVHERFTG